jgi:antitoxin CptB
MNTDANRLRWRSRRGMRELDQLLGWYLDTRYAQVDDATKDAFSTLLDQQDPDLWNWLTGRTAPDDASWRRIIDEIRGRNRV